MRSGLAGLPSLGLALSLALVSPAGADPEEAPSSPCDAARVGDRASATDLYRCFASERRSEAEASKLKAFYATLDRDPVLSPLRSATVDEVLDRAEVENLVTEYTEYRKRLGWFGSVFLEGASLKARGGVTNNDGDSSSVSGVAEDLDKTEVDAGVEIGWYGRPIVRDFALRHFEQLQRPYLRYRNDRDKGLKRDDWIYWGLLDAVKLDLSAGYGTVLEDQQGDDNAKTTTKGLYTVRLRWEMPLGAHAGRNPLD